MAAEVWANGVWIFTVLALRAHIGPIFTISVDLFSIILLSLSDFFKSFGTN